MNPLKGQHNPFKIDNAKQRFFNSKEEYLAFRQAWKDFHNNQPLFEIKEIDVTPWELKRDKTKAPIYAKVKVSTLRVEHYVLYNVLRGHDSHRGFNPLKRESRLRGCYGYSSTPRPWFAVEEALWRLSQFADDLSDNKRSSWEVERIAKRFEDISKPFGGRLKHETMVTIAQLIKAHIQKQLTQEVSIPITRVEALAITRNILETAERERAEQAEKEAGKKGFFARLMGW